MSQCCFGISTFCFLLSAFCFLLSISDDEVVADSFGFDFYSLENGLLDKLTQERNSMWDQKCTTQAYNEERDGEKLSHI